MGERWEGPLWRVSLYSKALRPKDIVALLELRSWWTKFWPIVLVVGLVNRWQWRRGGRAGEPQPDPDEA